MDYTELVKELLSVGTCAPGYEPLLSKAADAIEELTRQRNAAEVNREHWEKFAGEMEVNWHVAEGKLPRWISVKERLPENNAEVLAWSSSGFAYVDWWIDGAWKVNGLVDGKHEFVTHWMHLPEPPTILPGEEASE